MSNPIIVPPADYDNVDIAVRELFEEFIINLDGNVFVTSGYRKEDPGQHGLGLAIDFVAPAYAYRLLDLYHLTEQAGLFHGIGVYPAWSYQGQVVGGIHVDCRDGNPARWMGLGTDRTQQYVALTQDNLKKYGVI